MNKSYALVWNQALGCWNVASEMTRRRGKSGRSKIVVAAGASLLGLLGQAPAFALPSGAAVVAGEAGLQTSADGKHMVVDQHTNKLITNWNDFSVGGDERVSFHQPGKDSIALNRVIGTNGSDIQGRIDANGKVFLINPNGVVFGKTAQVNVGGLVASTRDIADKDFLDGNYRFTGNSGAAMSNAGSLSASEGGSIALLGAQVSNNGVIQAQMGSVALGAGKDFSVNFDGNGLLNLQVDSGAVDALAHNGGLIRTDGGRVLMTAVSADSLLKTVVSNEGVIEARTLQNSAGRIILDGGDSGTVLVAGRQDASALGGQGNGGVVDNRGARVEVHHHAQVDTRADKGTTGTWKIRSNEVIVAKAENPSTPAKSRGLVIGGDIDGNTGTAAAPTLHAETLASNLANTNVELSSSKGDLTVDAPVAWNNGNRLGLTAERGDVQLNTTVSASGDGAALALNAAHGGIRLNDNVALTGKGASLELNQSTGYSLKDGKAVTLSGTGAGFRANGQSYQVVQTLEQLRGIESNMNGRYVLGNRIVGQGRFKTIGDGDTFAGALDGLGNTISDLSLYGTSAFVGLFGANQGQISNLNLERISASGASSTHYNTQVGTLAALNQGRIHNVKAKDVVVTGASHANSLGGLVALNLGGTIEGSTASGKVIGDGNTYAMGGLVGENNSGSYGIAKIANSHSNVTISGQMSNDSSAYGAGGLVGSNRGGIIANSSSSGAIELAGEDLNIGGLAGNNLRNGSISSSSASTRIAAGHSSRMGGLVGFNQQASVANSHASGQVTGNGAQAIGGLIGKSQGGSISNSSASGNVSDTSSRNLGGLVGHVEEGRIVNASASGKVTGGSDAYVGGLVGYSRNASIANASSTSATVVGGAGASIGGLVGYSQNTAIANASASATVTGGNDSKVGGLVGTLQGNRISNSTAKGVVNGGNNSQVGGLVGINDGQITNSKASGQVGGGYGSILGGLVGVNLGSVTLSSASGKIDRTYSQIYGGLIGMNFGPGKQSLNRVSGEAAKVPMIGRSFSF
ncbi:hypothetical protein FQZ97_522900 [compost metagenome]